MTNPEIVADRLAGNLDTFMMVHKADLVAMCLTMDLDVDLLLMDMVAAGYQEVKTRAMQMLAGGEYDKLVESIRIQMGVEE